VRKYAGKEPTGRPGLRWENNIKTDFQEIKRGVDWFDLAKDRRQEAGLL
jgi:hypothetical protein